MSTTNGFFSGGKFYADILQTRLLEILDDNDKVRMELTTDPQNGVPFLTVKGKKEETRITLSLYGQEENPHLTMYDANGNRQIQIATLGGFSALQLYDTQDSLRLVVYVDEGCPAITLYDKNQVLRMSIYLSEEGTPYHAFYNDQEEFQAKVTVPEDGKEGLIFEGEGDDVEIVATSEPDANAPS